MSAIFTNQLDQILTDTANISIHPFGDEVYSIAETGFAHRIELESLETIQNVSWFDLLFMANLCCKILLPLTQNCWYVGK